MGKKQLIAEILEIELKMFVAVRSRYPVSCQKNPEGFCVMRSAQFSVWSEKTLRSYLSDLKKALDEGRNLMTLKYARIENLIPPLHKNYQVDEMLDEIVMVEMEWQKAMFSKYPALISRGRPLTDAEKKPADTSFKTYLKCEMETYSDQTLLYLLEDVRGHQARNENMTEKIYKTMVKSMGYASLEQADAAAAGFV